MIHFKIDHFLNSIWTQYRVRNMFKILLYSKNDTDSYFPFAGVTAQISIRTQ